MEVSLERTNIPPFPALGERLLRLPSAGAQAGLLEKIIESDALFAARFLECVNAPNFGLPAPASNSTQVITQIGAIRTWKVAFTLVMKDYFHSDLETAEHRRCWRHSVAAAFLTEELAWTCSFPDELGYVAGLLHDVGRMALVRSAPAEFGKILRLASQRRYDILELERGRFGMDHCELGRKLAEAWNLPHEIRVVTGRHHDRADTNEVSLLFLVQQGCRLADALGFEAVTPAQAQRVEEIKAALPPEAQGRFCPNLDDLKAALENELTLYAGVAVAVPEPVRPAVSRPRVAESLPQPPGARPLPSNLTLALIGALVAAVVTIVAMLR